jgi:hypothetical protein
VDLIAARLADRRTGASLLRVRSASKELLDSADDFNQVEDKVRGSPDASCGLRPSATLAFRSPVWSAALPPLRTPDRGAPWERELGHSCR